MFGINWVLFPNTATAFEIDDLGIYEGLHVRRFVQFVQSLIDPSRFPETTRVGELQARLRDYTSPFLDVPNVRYLIFPQAGGVSSLGPGIELVYDADAKIFRRTHAMPRAYAIYHWTKMRTEEGALSALKNGYDFRSSVLLEVADQSLRDPGKAALRPLLPSLPPSCSTPPTRCFSR